MAMQGVVQHTYSTRTAHRRTMTLPVTYWCRRSRCLWTYLVLIQPLYFNQDISKGVSKGFILRAHIIMVVKHSGITFVF